MPATACPEGQPSRRPLVALSLLLVLVVLAALFARPAAAPGSALTDEASALDASSQAVAESGFGAFVPGPPNPHAPVAAEFEEKVDRRLDGLHWFSAWTSRSGVFTTGPGDTTVSRLNSAATVGRIPLLTWEPWDPTAGVEQPEYSLATIARGDHDGYVTAWAEGLRSYGRVVYLRPMHEMNSDWYPWAGTENGNSAEEYIAAWKHLRAIFSSVGATNVKFVWSVNNYDIPASNRFEQYWPGSGQVDVLAIDGYNCYRPWTSFEDLFSDAYERIASLDPVKPIWITETSTCEPSSAVPGSEGESKAEWVEEMLHSTAFPRLSMLFWFDEAKSHDWRVDSSEGSRWAFDTTFDRYGK